jgi:hypothetical protein
VFVLAPWRSSKAQAFAPNFGLLDRVAWISPRPSNPTSRPRGDPVELYSPGLDGNILADRIRIKIDLSTVLPPYRYHLPDSVSPRRRFWLPEPNMPSRRVCTAPYYSYPPGSPGTPDTTETRRCLSQAGVSRVACMYVLRVMRRIEI